MDHLFAALVAHRFHREGKAKKEIADEFGISRFKVARILEQALADGIVTIQISVPPELDLALSQEVADRFGLRQAVVVRPVREGPVGLRRQLGQACASVLAERLGEDDVLGVAWGRTLHALTDVLPVLPRIPVVQLVGSVPIAELDVNSLELVRRLGERSGGPVHALHVPMVLESTEVAALLRAERQVAATVAAYQRVTLALVGIGDWHDGGSVLRAVLPSNLVARLGANGAVADLCSTVLDRDGRVVDGDTVSSHCIAITTEQLRAVPDVTAAAGGVEKVPAIVASVRAGLVHRLITDDSAARALLSYSDRADHPDHVEHAQAAAG